VIDSATGAGARTLALSLRRGNYVIRISGVYEDSQSYALNVSA
jgi:hypothetical protein